MSIFFCRPHFKAPLDPFDSDTDDPNTEPESVTNKRLNQWFNKNRIVKNESLTCKIKIDKSAIYQTSRFRLHPYSAKSTTIHSPSINNQIFLESIASNFAKKSDSQHLILKRIKSSHSSYFSTNSVGTKVQMSATQVLSPLKSPSIAPASSVYQLNFPLPLVASSPKTVVINNCTTNQKGPNKLSEKVTPVDNSTRTSQLIVVASQPIVSRNTVNTIQQAFISHKTLQSQTKVKINSFHVQPVVNSVRANKLSISNGLSIGHSSVVTNGISDAAQLVR